MLKKITAARINHMDVREFELKTHSLPEAREYIEERLVSMGQPRSSVMEAVIVFEEVFMAAVHQRGNSKAKAKISVENRFGQVTVNCSMKESGFRSKNFRTRSSARAF